MERRTTLWLSLAIVVGTFCLYALPFPDWRFWGDDYGAFDVAQINSVRAVAGYFGESNNHRMNYPSNTRDTTAWTFSFVSFRPMTLMMYAAESWLLGGRPSQAFFLIFMLLFAVVALVAFRWFALFATVPLAVLGTVFFIMHSALGGWLGAWAAQTYLILFMGFSGILYLLWWFFDRRAWWALSSAVGIFFLLLLFHEQMMILPVWLIGVLPFYVAYRSGRSWYDRKVLQESFWVALPFFAAFGVYLLCRWWCYPCAHEPVVSFAKKVPCSARFFDLVTYVVELVGLTWMPCGIRLIKGLVLSGIFLYFLLLFIWSEEKLFLGLLLWSVVCWSWPSILLRHQNRFLFLALPFLIVFVLRGIAPLFRHVVVYKRVVAWFGVGLLVFLSIMGLKHNFDVLRMRSYKAIVVSDAFQQLVHDPAVQNKAICFVGIPRDWFPGEGITQAIWLYRGSRELPVYYDDQLCVYCFASMGVKESIHLAHHPLVKLSIDDNVIKLSSLDREHGWFYAIDDERLVWPCSMGMVSRQEPGPKAYEITVTLDRKWLRDDLVFVTWDFTTWQFVKV